MIGYNYGAKKKDRVIKIIKYFIKLSIIITAIGMVIILVFPTQLLEMFEVSKETTKLGIPAFRILSLGIIFAGINLVLSATFQAFGNAIYSLIISLLRKVLIAMPIIYCLKEMFGLSIVWWAFTIAEVLTMVVAVIIYKKTFNKLLKQKY